ncbi:MAG: FkbM family methyltransferase [Oscillospiraceae bacterium]|nr:FkbM family methyltransferase [Oscillospiraceae bacterium]
MLTESKYEYAFPFDKIQKGSKIALYGAGLVGKQYLEQIQNTDYCEVLCIIDRNYAKIRTRSGFDVVSPDWLRQPDKYDYVVIASWWYAESMVSELKSMDIAKSKIVCTFPIYHAKYPLHGEDVAVYMIFKCINKNRFTYIDLGANHPFHGSNTAILYSNGCRGICVEANPDIIKMLKQFRPEDIVLNVGVGVQPGVLPYYMFETNVYNTFSIDAAKCYEAVDQKIAETRMIPVMTANEIIMHYANNKWPDFLQIDIEGWDYDVLKSCDFSQNAPSVICSEVGDANVQNMNCMLDEKGFSPFYRTVSNMIYIRKDILKRIQSVHEH